MPSDKIYLNKAKKNHKIEKNSFKFTSRQLDCLCSLLFGHTAKEIAKIHSLSPRTVEGYINEMKLKAGCQSKSKLIRRTIKAGYLYLVKY